MGMERLLALMETLDLPVESPVDVYLIRVGEKAEQQGIIFAETLRDKIQGIKLQVDCAGGSFKSQFKKADKSGAAYALILGDDEVSRSEISIKPLRNQQEQLVLSQTDAITLLQTSL
jgi:histidyl-tRNA synthetase